MTSICSSLTLALLALPGAPQDLTPPFSEGWRWVQFTTDSGLPSDRVLEVVETSRGTPWARTTTGLAWYDGFEWQAIEPPGSSATTTITQVCPDLQGGVLVVSAGRIYRGDENGLAPLEVTAGAPLTVTRVVPLAEDELLVQTRDALYRFGSGELREMPAPEDVRGLTTRTGRTKAGTVWASQATTTYAWKDGDWTPILDLGVVHLEALSGEEVVAVDDSTGTHAIWTALPGSSMTFVGGDRFGFVTAIDATETGEAVVAYASGQVLVRHRGEWSSLAPVPAQLINPQLVRFQRNGDLWVGSDTGLFLYRGSSTRWTRWPIEGSGDETRVNALLPTSDGDTWIGTNQGLVVRGPDGSVEHIRAIGETLVGVVTGLAEDAEGGIWVSSGAADGFDGAFRRHAGTWRHFGASDGLLARRVHRITRDLEGRLWFLGLSPNFGVSEPGAFVHDDGRFVPWGVREGLLDGRVYAFAEGPPGTYWFGTWQGISRWDGDSWTHWTAADGLKHRIFTLAISPEGRAWFGHKMHETGLGSVDEDGEVRYFTSADGLVDDHVNDLRFDAEGGLWIGTQAGLSRYRDGSFLSFHRAHGLAHPHLWPVLPREDAVIVGTIGGGAYVLSLAEAQNPAPRVSLSPPLVDGTAAHFRWKAFAFGGELRPDQIETRYRIDDESWSPWTRTRELSAAGLPPGEHTLGVQARSLFGRVDVDGSVTTFAVAPPFHRRPSFLAAMIGWVATVAGIGAMYWSRRRRQSRLLQASEERLRTLVNEMPIGVYELDLAGCLRSINPAGLRILGAEREAEMLGLDYRQVVARADRELVERLLGHARAGRSSEFEFARAHDGGGTASSLVPVKDAHGTVIKVMGYLQDITDRQRAEMERRRLEDQLRQSQKLEAIGMLAGGVAHDFNNLLTVIGGHASLIQEEAASLPSPVQGSLREILKGYERARSLTRQLLAFGRKQVLQPQVLDLNGVACDLESMLTQLIGPAVTLHSRPSGGSCLVDFDRGQLEQVIVNVVVNARDAMPDGGTLTLEVLEDVPGPYVGLDIRDTGCGMDEETRARIFEPFFTTKPRDKGTGLGLSTVYGILKQGGGYVSVDSAVGRGTHVEIRLPRAVGQPTVPDRVPAALPRRGGTETILVAEDDSSILGLAVRVLDDLGYAVLRATDGAAAIRISADYAGRIDLLLTDIVMPGLNGQETALQVTTMRPECRVLFMSGYADDRVVDEIEWGEPWELLQKPFDPSTLARTVRSVLDAPAPAEAPPAS